MSVVGEVMKTLPPKIVNRNGINYYLTMECRSDDYSFWVFYKSSSNGEKIAETWFASDEPEPRYKLEEMMLKLQELGYRKLPSPNRTGGTGTSLVLL